MAYSNGTLIDKDVTLKLQELGNVAPAISIEGLEEETDHRRGKGVWKKIMQTPEQRLYGWRRVNYLRNKYPVFIGDFWKMVCT